MPALRRLGGSLTLPGSLRRCATILRIQAPPLLPVRVHLVAGLSDEGGAYSWGDCARGPKVFTIRLDAALARDYPEVAALVLVHEWAHTHAWAERDAMHGREFGLAYSYLYRLWMAEIE